MSKHTPGPWKVASASACAEIEVMEIAEIAHLRVIPTAGGWPTPGEPEVDARLIAAAPELLDALRQWAAAERDGDEAEFANARQSRDAAIAKAIGEQA